MFIAGLMSAIFLPLKKEKVEKASAIFYSFDRLYPVRACSETIDPDEAGKRVASSLSR